MEHMPPLDSQRALKGTIRVNTSPHVSAAKQMPLSDEVLRNKLEVLDCRFHYEVW